MDGAESATPLERITNIHEMTLHQSGPLNWIKWKHTEEPYATMTFNRDTQLTRRFLD